MYASSNVVQETRPNICRKLCSLLKKQQSILNMQLINDTSSIGYVGLQLMKGKIIVIDNSVKETKSMIIKENYVIAHTSNVTIGVCKPRQGER